MSEGLQQLVIRSMTIDDLPAVMNIDRLSFSTPWSERSFHYELIENPASCLRVAEFKVKTPQIAGYAGFWMLVDEAHISTLAVHPHLQRQGIGGRLLLDVIKRAIALRASLISLEVRQSNQGAINMYHERGFEIVGKRVGYYKDNQEDAILMMLTNLRDAIAADGGDT